MHKATKHALHATANKKTRGEVCHGINVFWNQGGAKYPRNNMEPTKKFNSTSVLGLGPWLAYFIVAPHTKCAKSPLPTPMHTNQGGASLTGTWYGILLPRSNCTAVH